MAKIEPAKSERERKILRTDLQAKWTTGGAPRSHSLIGNPARRRIIRPAIKV